MRFYPRGIIAAAVIAMLAPTAYAQRNIGAGGGANGGGGRVGSYSGLTIVPRAERRIDEAESAHLLRDIRKAQSEVSRVVIDLRREFVQSDEYRAAVADFREASAAYRLAREAALAPLRASVDFKAIQLKIHRLESQLEELRAQPNASSTRISQLAEMLLQERGELSKRQNELLGEDERFTDARYALIDASGHLSTLWQEFQDSVRYDSRAEAARQRLADARQRLASR